MTEAERTGLEHVILPRRLPGLALLSRSHPAPADNQLDAALAAFAASRRVDVPLHQHIAELYATRCATCRRPTVADQFIWPRDADAPGRKIYRCSSCDLTRAGPEERASPVDEVDLAKLGIDRPPEEVAIPDDDPPVEADTA